ncbi:hypothetical protein NHX12_027512 [Muraenolepis orangiensis]|uniref:Uncharacterized protein n=1 Tax=Muraenolepis orangiensis TaxID=630683 RepID=A0A9Q0EER4_9TELE|nr:hypothetical protein NHX12_027512 [Muraenolepis orangiensis]
MLTPPSSQMGGAPPFFSPGRGWDLGAPWGVTDHDVIHHHDNDDGTHHCDDAGTHHRDDASQSLEDDMGHHRDNHVGHHCDNVSHHHENNLRVPPPPSSRPPPHVWGRDLAEQQLLPLSLLKEALAPVCLRLAAVEAGLERLWLSLPLLVMQGGGAMPDRGGARRRKNKGEEEKCVVGLEGIIVQHK